MQTLDQLLEQLWLDYIELNDGAKQVHQAITDQGETIVNDHIALRTFDDERVNIQKLAQSFINFGYVPKGEYTFPAKHLYAKHFEHPDPQYPLVFISELVTRNFSDELQNTLRGLVDQVTDEMTKQWNFSVSGRPWNVSHETYEKLRAESEYAAWVAAWGFRANHFTVSVNHLNKFNTLESLNTFLKDSGFSLNTSGGEIKGTPEQLLEQSSTLASVTGCDFSDGQENIPCCYYEFARRYPQSDGQLFRGFIAQSADKIFESTDHQDK